MLIENKFRDSKKHIGETLKKFFTRFNNKLVFKLFKISPIEIFSYNLFLNSDFAPFFKIVISNN